MKTNRDLNDILTNNLIHYRKEKGLTQIQLAEELNYSDKSISKWERGEGLPDVLVLKQLATFYGIEVDDFFKEEKKKIVSPYTKRRDHIFIGLLSIGVTWIVTTLVFFLIQTFTSWDYSWLIFIYGIMATCVVSVTFACIFWSRIWFLITVSCLVWSTVLSLHLSLLLLTSLKDVVFIYFIGIACQISAIVWYLYLIYLKDKK